MRAMTRDWTIEEQGELIREMKLMRPTTEIASALQRDEADVLEKIGELGLDSATTGSAGQGAKDAPRAGQNRRE
jgi:hypothetical protein